MIGIYIITNELDNKVYIGQVGKGDTKTFMKRFDEHYKGLSKNKYMDKNKKPTHLQCAWNNNGEENFTFDILEECTKEELNDREIYWIAYYESSNPKYGYNKTPGGDGINPTPEIREKISKANKGRKCSSEELKIRSENNKGEKNPNYGKKTPEETKEKIRKANQNKIVSEQTKIKQSIKAKARGIPKEQLLRMQEARNKNGRVCTEETKQKIIQNMPDMSGRNSPRWIEPTEEMIEDVKNGITRKRFTEKYNEVSSAIWTKIRRVYVQIQKNNI